MSSKDNTTDKTIKYMLNNSEVIKRSELGDDKKAADKFMSFIVKRQASS